MRLLLLVIGLLVTGALVAGCGGDDEGDNTGAGTPPAETTSAPETTPPADTGGSGEAGGSGGGANPSNPQIEQAVEACKSSIGAQPGISEDVKADLEEICEKAASGDEQDVQKATKEVCVKLIEENVPEGPAREQALAACDQAGQTP